MIKIASGFGLHFPRLDVNLYLPARLESLGRGPPGPGGGKAQTPAKQAAARANGRLGGRPRKVA